jgi:hypothetical protein
MSRDNPVFGWWAFTRHAVDALTMPPADTDGCDRDIEQLAHTSLIWTTAHRLASRVDDDWRRSRSRSTLSTLGRWLTPTPSSAALCAGGWTIAVAGVTALGLNAVKPIAPGPLTWVVPAACAAVGALLMVVAARGKRD